MPWWGAATIGPPRAWVCRRACPKHEFGSVKDARSAHWRRLLLHPHQHLLATQFGLSEESQETTRASGRFKDTGSSCQLSMQMPCPRTSFGYLHAMGLMLLGHLAEASSLRDAQLALKSRPAVVSLPALVGKHGIAGSCWRLPFVAFPW